MAGDRSGSIRGWVEAAAAAVAALAAAATVVLTQVGGDDATGTDVPGAGAPVSTVSTVAAADSAHATAVDRIRTFFVVDDGAGCTDITATAAAEPGRLAVLGCTVAGGAVSVDLSRFESPAAVTAYFDRIRSAVGEGGEVTTWHLGGTGAARTGWTLEFLARGGRATILWTYEARGMAAMASRDDEDQAALNEWWRSIGSLVEDDVAAEVIAGR